MIEDKRRQMILEISKIVEPNLQSVELEQTAPLKPAQFVKVLQMLKLLRRTTDEAFEKAWTSDLIH